MTSVTFETISASPSLKSVQSRKTVRILLMAIGAIACLVYIEWRVTRNSVPPVERQADTMCIASRFGLSCQE